MRPQTTLLSKKPSVKLYRQHTVAKSMLFDKKMSNCGHEHRLFGILGEDELISAKKVIEEPAEIKAKKILIEEAKHAMQNWESLIISLPGQDLKKKKSNFENPYGIYENKHETAIYKQNLSVSKSLNDFSQQKNTGVNMENSSFPLIVKTAFCKERNLLIIGFANNRLKLYEMNVKQMKFIASAKIPYTPKSICLYESVSHKRVQIVTGNIDGDIGLFYIGQSKSQNGTVTAIIQVKILRILKSETISIMYCFFTFLIKKTYET